MGVIYEQDEIRGVSTELVGYFLAEAIRIVATGYMLLNPLLELRNYTREDIGTATLLYFGGGALLGTLAQLSENGRPPPTDET